MRLFSQIIIFSFFLFVLSGGFFLPVIQAQSADKTFTSEERQFLVNLLETKGFERQFLNRIFYHSKLQKLPVIISKNVINKESKSAYDDFLSPYSLQLARKFSKNWRTILQKASQRFEVDREVLIAILLVETGLGNVLGNYPVISIFSSILVENQNQQVSGHVQTQAMSYNDYRIKRLRRKAQWAEKELTAFLQIVKDTPYGAFQIKGSFAGAFGIPQFLPSSYLKWGYDSDRNGSVNLYLIPDAVYSVANYLKAHGWKKGLHHKSNRQVIRKYNNSRLYVDAILGVARRMNQYYQRQAAQKSDSTDEVSTILNTSSIRL